MSTVMARRVASTPTRTAAQTWQKIVEILTSDAAGESRKELNKAAGVACASISSEATRDAAIVVWGGGPRVRVYCVFDEDAITGDGVSEGALPTSPTEGDWKMSIPCLSEDVAWSKESLAKVSTRITARAPDEEIDEADDSKSTKTSSSMAINLSEFLKS